eukprot:CAMPEP_0171996302 /NCGR_PEP_ID=MMETSP1041-20130122/47_1 /TAXON_ID=464988 /ORGANISM="Hemiselmis andersenii, Strain CCMP439" /LENGTH=72 /DNA_ID=CAMNT_0012649433 /DNA_START=2931 /DNA_END=3149 /DNA_ORIENTATION=-
MHHSVGELLDRYVQRYNDVKRKSGPCVIVQRQFTLESLSEKIGWLHHNLDSPPTVLVLVIRIVPGVLLLDRM